MTRVGAGGVVVRRISFTKRFQRDYSKLVPELQALVEAKLRQLQADPMPAGLRFEKLKGHRRPSIYTIHVTGNYKISMEMNGDNATLRRIAEHDENDRKP